MVGIHKEVAYISHWNPWINVSSFCIRETPEGGVMKTTKQKTEKMEADRRDI